MSDYAQRIARVSPSMTLQINAEAAAMQDGGEDVARLGAGEPDFDTPEPIKAAAKRAIDEGFTHYTAAAGTQSLKRAVCDKFRRENNLTYAPENIMVTCGAKQSLYNLCQTLLQPGDEAIVPQPYWVSYPAQVTMAEGEPVFVQCDPDEGFTLKPTALEAAISERTRLVFLNSPNNPTGRIYDRAELAAIGEVLRKYPGILIVCDEIYEHLRWVDGPYQNFLNVNPDLKNRCVVVNGVSKAYAMTGWRVGYMAGPKDLIETMDKLQGQSTAGTCSISQHAAEQALRGDQGIVTEMTQAFRRRHDRILPEVKALPNVSCQPAEGAFYLLPDFRTIIAERDDIEDDIQLAHRLLQEAKVALVPGSAFGAPGHLRLSFAADLDTNLEGIRRIEQFLAA
ncbi:pyridoxal phosphate-dependent aminotransferase [Marinobacter fonticola]|uniref:pyridoxal phosphate-dependent aminotransferase n=1 Tax=Marinobacter fonticola TaxID=2603215 RepID=UPI0011E83D8E|nr:pyridoxal phosphate-dependent aminotransferase [Marinobacter fonticola]